MRLLMRYTCLMGRGKTAVARDQFSAIFGERRTGNPDAVSIEEEDEALRVLQELRGSTISPLEPAVGLLKSTSRRDGLYAELVRGTQERAARAATAAVGIKPACKHGVFDVTEPMIERWCDTLVEGAARQARFHAAQPVGPSANPARTPLLEWLHECEGLATVLENPTLKHDVLKRIKDFIGPEGITDEQQRDLPRLAGRAWRDAFANAAIDWLDSEPGDPLLASIICSEADRRTLEESLGHELPRVIDVFERSELSKRLGELLVITAVGGDDPSVNVYETPHHQDLSTQLWAPYAAALLRA
jgi:hypothetical protein